MANLETPRFVDGQPLLIAGLDDRFEFTNMSGISGLWDRVAPHLGHIPGQVGQVAYGVSHQLSPQGFRYIAGVEVSDAAGLPEGFTAVEVPTQHYAVFTHTGHVSELAAAFGQIWTQWLPHSGYRVPEGAMMLERYGENFNPETGSGDITIWYPISPVA